MEKQEFTIAIDAPREKVWTVLWNDEYYRAWTAAFTEGSHAITDWKKGSKVLFLDGKGMGMVSRIDETIPNEYMSFEHLGSIKDGVEDVTSDEAKSFAGAHENYTLKDRNGKTELVVDMDMNDEFKDYFIKTMPKALEKVKELAEHA
ncbi:MULTISPECIES: SRPBCC family protein [Niastella]|uniref:SRPBCC domain-containing protein n=1 Tax=Niastella soli TaxID=2821487 RepID=A0ABS3Z255_9BACT|nr:SRPBCC domain-containing protein [Niastella soli]MBO9204103.1 SRPBCC domain-containing protein [Niastella soli]